MERKGWEKEGLKATSARSKARLNDGVERLIRNSPRVTLVAGIDWQSVCSIFGDLPDDFTRIASISLPC